MIEYSYAVRGFWNIPEKIKYEMETLYCIKEIKDPRYSDIKFEECDSVMIEDEYYGKVVIQINGIDICHGWEKVGTGVPMTDRERMDEYKADFFMEIMTLSGFKMEDHFVPLASYRQRRIEDILNDYN